MVQDGQLGQFSITALLLQLSTSVAMLAIATVAVDLIATTCVPPWAGSLRPCAASWCETPAAVVSVPVASEAGAVGASLTPLWPAVWSIIRCLKHHNAYKEAKTEEYQFGPDGKHLLLVTKGADGKRRLSRRSKSVARKRSLNRRDSGDEKGFAFDGE